MKHLTIKIEFEDDQEDLIKATIGDKLLGGTISAACLYDLFKCFDVAEKGLKTIHDKTLEPLCDYTLDKINNIMEKE